MKRVYGKVLVLCGLLLFSVTALHAARLTLFIDGDNRTPYDASRGKVGRAEWTAAVNARKGAILTDDFNGVSQEGAGLYQVTCRKGRRWSTNEAYLKPASSRSNLTVETGALASRVELDGSRATGRGLQGLAVLATMLGRPGEALAL